MTKPGTPTASELGARTKKFLAAKGTNLEKMPFTEVQGLVQRLLAHQLMLENQVRKLTRVQEDLKESRARYSHLYDAAPLGYFALNPQGLVVEANLPGADLLGVERPSLLQEPFLAYIKPEFQEVFRVHLQRAFATGTRQVCRLDLAPPNRPPFPVEVWSLAEGEAAGAPSHCHLNLIHLGEGRQTETAIQHLASFAQLNPNPVLEVDPFGTITYHNAATVEALQRFGGKEVRDFLPPDLAQILKAAAATEERQFYREVKIGEAFFGVNLGWVPQFQVARLYATDITARRQAEEELDSRHRELLLLHRISQISLTTPSSGKVFQEIVAEISRATGFPIAALELYNPVRETMLFLGVTGFTPSPKGGSIEVPVNQTLSGVVAKTGRILIETEPRKRPEYAHSAWRRLGIRTFVCLPLKTDQGVIGALSLAHSRKVEVSEALCRWAATLANYTAALMEHRRVEEAVRQSEARYRTLVETSPDGIVVLDLNATIKMANRQAAALTGYTSPQELAGKRVSDLISPTQGPQLFETIEQTVAVGVMRNFQVTVLREDRTPLPVEINASLIKDSQNQPLGIIALVRDITARRQAEESLRRATRALKTLNECNQALVRATDEAVFLQDVCRIIVEVGGYRLAWVGFAQHDAAKTVLPVAYYGTEGDGPDWIKITWGDDDKGQGPGGKAIRTGQTCVVKNIGADPGLAPWRGEARRRGLVSIIALPLRVGGRPLGILDILAQTSDAFDAEEVQLLEELAGELAYGIEALRTRAAHLKAEAQLHESFAKLQRTLQGTVLALSSAVERWDPYTSGHQKRVAILASAIAREMGLSRDLVQGLCVAGLVHDIGKIGIPAEILSKPRRLTDLEFALIKTHPLAASEILQAAEFPWPLADIILKHHERLDGSGYPAGLKGDQIPLEARILAVADVVEAMVSHRPHRPGFSLDQALEEVSRKRGLLYDPQVVEACIKLFKEKGFNFDLGPPHLPTMMEEGKQAAL